MPLRDDRTNRWNHRVKSAARAYPHVHVLDDWRNAVRAAAPGALVVRTEWVHPNRAGARRLASIFTQAIHHLC